MTETRGKVLVAMSGGVDSSVAAALLQRAGFEVVGCFMRLGTVGESLEEADGVCATGGGLAIRHRGCCSVSDAADARLVAATLGIPLYVCNFKREFARVIDYFADEYAAGRTPNPCVRCNDWLKFGRLHGVARDLGCRAVASGHYARVVPDPVSGEARLARGVDESKDQSYVLFGVGRERLGEMMLPIGEMRKSDVRALARELGLPVSDKPDSQEICFVPDDDYAGLVERLRPELSVAGVGKGELVDAAGRVVGEHAGQHRFTVGQRRVGVAFGRPVYVVERDAATNRVRVGGRDELRTHSCVAGEACWLASEPGALGRAWVRYRSNGALTEATWRVLDDAHAPGQSGRAGRFEVKFAVAQEAVAPGQALVLYDDAGLVVGGGWIESVRREGAAYLGERENALPLPCRPM